MNFKKLTFFVFFVASAVMVNAQIVYTDINPDVSTTLSTNPGSLFNVVSIDFNGDNTEEYNFRWDMFNQTTWWMHMTKNINNTNDAFVFSATQGQSGSLIEPLTLGTTIGPASSWGGAGLFGLGDPLIGADTDLNFQNLGDRYIGVKFHLAGNVHYGWVLVDFTNLTLTVKGYAYNATPNTPINAGDTGGINPVILVTSISVQGQGGASTITTPNGTLQMQETVLPNNATNSSVTWSVQNGTGSATINATGLLTATGDGTVTVTAAANDASGISGTAVITISNQATTTLVTSISVQGQGGVSTITMPNGTLQMQETVLPNNATNSSVTWSVQNGTGSATINATGLLTATGDGTVTVTATANDASGVSGTAIITISNQAPAVLVTSISLQGAGGATTIQTSGGTLQISAIVLPANATNNSVSWSVSNGTGSATISNTGLLTAVTDGTVTVRATANDASGITGDLTVTLSNQTVGVNEWTTHKPSIFPNPVTDALTLKNLDTRGVQSIAIFSIHGQKVFEQNGLTTASKTINVQLLPKGSYVLSIILEDNSTQNLRFIKS